MPTSGSTERDPKRWQRCRDATRKTMLAAGWIERSGKFQTVLHRKASKLYNTMC